MTAESRLPKVKDLRRGEEGTSADRHHALADQRAGQWFSKTRPECLEAEPPRVGQSAPLLARHLGELEPLALVSEPRVASRSSS